MLPQNEFQKLFYAVVITLLIVITIALTVLKMYFCFAVGKKRHTKLTLGLKLAVYSGLYILVGFAL